MRNFLISAFCFVIMLLSLACENSFIGLDNEKSSGVIIRISNSNGRTIMPVTPVFNRYELTLRMGEDLVTVTDTSGIDGAGVSVSIPAGTWIVTLKAYQDILGDGIGLLAAIGTYELTINSGDSAYVIEMELNPIAIGDSVEKGLFSFNITLPDVADTAILSLKDSLGELVEGFEAYDLIATNSGSIALAPGYYDMSIILTRNGQFAGIFESAHIYSGLESPAVIDLSGIVFADKVYLLGQLGGIRIGTISITRDEAGSDIIKTLELERASAIRSGFWIIDIPADNIGKTIYAILEFNGEKVTKKIPVLEARGSADVDLELLPESVKYVNLAAWYSTITAEGNNPEYAADGNKGTFWNPENSSTGLVIDYGFDVTVNFSRLMFYSASGSTGLESYSVDYWNGGAWVQLVQREQSFAGSTDGSVYYSDFFNEVTAQKFRWRAVQGNVPPVSEFSLYNAADRLSLIDAVAAALENRDSAEISSDGKDVHVSLRWVTPEARAAYQNAVAAAQAAMDDPYLKDGEIAEAKEALAAATEIFNDAKSIGSVFEVPEKDFIVQDGYAGRFVVSWKTFSGFEYNLYMSETDSIGNLIFSANSSAFTYPVLDVISDINDEGTGEITVIVSAAAGITRYFSLVPVFAANNQPVPAIKFGPCMTLGAPVLTLVPGYSYSTITAVWTEAQMADAYRIMYRYKDEASWTTSATVVAGDLSRNGDNFTYSFRPRGYNETANSGKELRVIVEALNSAANSHTTSNEGIKRLVGPSGLDIKVSQAASADYIDVSWNAIPGAGGYYVFRRQFNMANTAETGAKVMYYVSADAVVTADTAVTATASVTGSSFTLFDLPEADYDYSGSFSGYLYRYVVVPVINVLDIPAIDYNNNSYTLQEKGEAVTVTGLQLLEKIGHAVGFAEVTATKGTYASTGNVNNGIRVTWSKPARFADAGLQYFVYRRAFNGSWELATGPTGALEYIDNPSRGIMYEYAVGVRYVATDVISYGPSLPQSSPRYIEWSRTNVNNKGIPNLQGFIQNTVTMNNVTRGEDAEVNAVFGERVTWNGSGIAYGGSDVNWGVDGYTLYIMNRNINANWHVIAGEDVAQHITSIAAPFNTGATQSILLTPANTRSVTITDSIGTFTRNLLFVLRDYKHFFKVRSYVWNGDEKVYSPDPDWTYQYRFGTSQAAHVIASNQMEDDYVKWGARQVTINEFITIASLYVARGVERRRGGTWTSTLTWGQANASTSNGGSGHVRDRSNTGVSTRDWEFRNYKDDLMTRAGNWVTFLTVDGDMWMGTRASGWPQAYGRAVGSFRDNRLWITGPWDTPHLYTGEIHFGGGSTLNVRRGEAGDVHVRYPTNSTQQTIRISDGLLTPLAFDYGLNNSNNRHRINDAEWR